MSLSRRKFVQDTAAFASLASMAKLGLGQCSAPVTYGKMPLYIILQGPWLFNVQGAASDGAPFTIDATTTTSPMGDHAYEYMNPRPGTKPTVLGDLRLNQSVLVTVNRQKTGQSAQCLYANMVNNNQGIFYKSSVELPSGPASDLFHVRLPNPDGIVPLGLMSGVTINRTSDMLQDVTSWPAALAFRYDDWINATIDGFAGKNGHRSPDTPTASATASVVRLFRISHHPGNMGLCDEWNHAGDYFGKVLSKLSKLTANPPQANITKDCRVASSAGSVTLGYLPHTGLTCTDIGDTSCVADQKMGGPTLVNCASGGGGTGGSGCC